MRLMSVVFPAPFGPISPKAWACEIARSTAFTATTPPKRLVRPAASSNIGRPDLLQPARAPKLRDRHEAARQVDDYEQQDQALEDVAVVLEWPQELRQGGEEGRSKDRPERIGDAADDPEDEDLHGLRECEVVRLDREREVRGETAGRRREQRTGNERAELVAVDPDALARRGGLVLADGRPRASDGRPLHAPQDVRDHREGEVDVPDLGRRGDAVEALALPGDRRREEDHPHDLAES